MVPDSDDERTIAVMDFANVTGQSGRLEPLLRDLHGVQGFGVVLPRLADRAA